MDSAERKRPGAQREYTYVRVYTYTHWRARSKESISRISRATAMGISFPSSSPRTCRPREPAPSLPAPAPWEWGGAVSSLGGRDDVEVSLRSLYTMPSPRSFYLRVARVHLRPSAKLYGRRGGRIVDRLLRPYWIIYEIKKRKRRIPRYFSFATDSYSEECREGRKEGRKAVRAFV